MIIKQLLKVFLLMVISLIFIQNELVGQKRKGKIDQDTIVRESFIIQPKRIEFEVGFKDENFHIVSADEEGLLVAKQTREHLDGGYQWELTFVDSLLEVRWNQNISIGFGSSFLGHDRAGDSFFLLFGTSQYKMEEMQVVELLLGNGTQKKHDVSLSLPLQLSHFEVVGRSLIFGGYSNYRPVISVFDLENDKNIVLPGYYNSNSTILDIQTDDRVNNFTVMSSEKLTNKQVTVSISTFTETGEQIHSERLQTESEKSLMDGVATSFDNGTQYIAGTFSKRKSDYSRGLYLSKLELGQQQFIKYHDYAELENFFSYMKAKREKRVKEKIERKNIKGQKVKFNYRLIVHQLIEREKEFIMIGEAYYPKYSNYVTTGPYDTGQSGMGSNFIGYNFTHAIVVGFSKSGEVLWDNSFEINDLLSYSLKDHVQISVENSRIVLLYVFENVIRSKIIMNDEIIEGKSFDPVELNFKSDEIKGHEKELEGIEKWFGGNFYTYGVHRIKNLKDKDVELNRKVFYINKIQYQ